MHFRGFKSKKSEDLQFSDLRVSSDAPDDEPRHVRHTSKSPGDPRDGGDGEEGGMGVVGLLLLSSLIMACTSAAILYKHRQFKHARAETEAYYTVRATCHGAPRTRF